MIIKNILPESYKTELKNLIGSNDFPWYWSDGTIRGAKEELIFQFNHLFYHKDEGGIASNLYQNIVPIIYFFEKETNLKVKKVHKVKANLLTKLDATDEEIKTCFHRDVGSVSVKDLSRNEFYENYVSLIYYVIDSDGDTVICDDNLNEIERVNPIAGNLVWFKSTLPHYGAPPKINKRRIVINFVLELEQENTNG
jgi:hypothetical protein